MRLNGNSHEFCARLRLSGGCGTTESARLGYRALPIEHLIKLCLFYKVSADYILGIPNFDE